MSKEVDLVFQVFCSAQACDSFTDTYVSLAFAELMDLGNKT